ncbi:MAG TPA: LysM peptidoglycan-binding domain-containing protein, partial [Pseudobdellovibrionaceae bacterium]|nr:LysM peptidoglycan-binding domain-containing protein [Pseudobdellovibrionaceae bacterium]
LYTIARRYGTTIQELSRLNNLRRGRILKVGMRLRLPSDESSSSDSKSASVRSSRRTASTKVHIVRRGENLSRIAERYNVAVSDIRKKNRIRNPSSVMAGARLVIPLARAND